MRLNVVENFHPAVWFTYFMAVLAASMLILHPLFIAAGLACALCVGLFFCGRKPVLRTLLFGLPVFILIALLNPLVGHGGRTVLLYVMNQTFTLEALLFGTCSGATLLLVFLWFCSYNRIVTPEKFMALFSRAAPAAALLVTMTQRLIPLFTRRAGTIATAQKTLLCDMAHGSLKHRFKSGVRITTVLMSWSLEDGLDTADSMKARGYGAGKRTFFTVFRFRQADAAALAVVLLCFSACLGLYYPFIRFSFYPALSFPAPGAAGALSLAAYLLLMLLPVFAGLTEELRWRL